MTEQFPFPNPQPEKSQAPMVYVTEEIRWKYKVVERNLAEVPPMNADDLNDLGKEGWELAGVLNHNQIAHYYFMRPA